MTAMEWLLAFALVVLAWWVAAASADTPTGRRVTGWIESAAAVWIAQPVLVAWHHIHPPQPPEEPAP